MASPEEKQYLFDADSSRHLLLSFSEGANLPEQKVADNHDKQNSSYNVAKGVYHNEF